MQAGACIGSSVGLWRRWKPRKTRPAACVAPRSSSSASRWGSPPAPPGFVRTAPGAGHQHGNRAVDRDLAAFRSDGRGPAHQRPVRDPRPTPHARNRHARRRTREPRPHGAGPRNRRALRRHQGLARQLFAAGRRRRGFLDQRSGRVDTSFGQAQRQFTWGVSGSQLLYSPGAHADLRFRRDTYRSTEHDYMAARLDTMLEAGVAYLDVLRAKNNERVNGDNLRLTRKNLALAETRNAIGVAGREEVFRWQTQIAESRSAVIGASALRNQAEIQLNRILNRQARGSVSGSAARGRSRGHSGKRPAAGEVLAGRLVVQSLPGVHGQRGDSELARNPQHRRHDWSEGRAAQRRAPPARHSGHRSGRRLHAHSLRGRTRFGAARAHPRRRHRRSSNLHLERRRHRFAHAVRRNLELRAHPPNLPRNRSASKPIARSSRNGSNRTSAPRSTRRAFHTPTSPSLETQPRPRPETWNWSPTSISVAQRTSFSSSTRRTRPSAQPSRRPTPSTTF